MIAGERQSLAEAVFRGKLVLLVFGLTFIPAYTFFSGSSVRFIVYVLPVFSFLVWFMFTRTGKLRFDRRFVYAVLLYLGLMVIVLAVSPQIDGRTLANVLRPFFYLLVFVPFMVFTHQSVRVLTVIFALATMALFLSGGATSSGGFDLLKSQGLLESGLAFPLGGVTLYFLLRGDRLWTFLALVLYVIAFKRVSFVAFGVALGYAFFLQAIARNFQFDCRKCTIIFCLLVLSASMYINTHYFEFFSLVIEILNLQIDVEWLTLGRLSEIDIVTGQYLDQGIMNVLFGNGPGDSTRRFVEITITYPAQVHNSYLLYFYDFGMIGSMLFLGVFWLVYSRNTFGLVLLAYNLIVMNTDNSFTHHFHQITYFILIAAMQHEAQRDRVEFGRKNLLG